MKNSLLGETKLIFRCTGEVKKKKEKKNSPSLVLSFYNCDHYASVITLINL